MSLVTTLLPLLSWTLNSPVLVVRKNENTTHMNYLGLSKIRHIEPLKLNLDNASSETRDHYP